MRNLKRALSLALALVMVLSMTLIGATAVSVDDFSDGADIVNKEAVTVLATLGVITGNDDGSYAPADTISRAEMSTIICRVLNGGKDPVLGESVTNSYTDTASHWAKNYIEYCSTLGIVAGKGDGTFDPEGDVTVAEAAKMVLVALGYNAPMEGYVGGAWQINVDARANPIGLYDDLTYTSTSAALTRDNAAQMLYNALDCDMVKYDVVLDTTSSTVISTTQLGETGETLLEDKFEAVKVEGVVIANEVANLESSATNGSALADGRTKIRIDEEADQTYYHGDETFSVSSDIDDLGRYVSIYVKKDRNAVNAQVLGSVIVSEDNNVVIDASSDSVQTVLDDNDLDWTGDTLAAKNYQGLTGLTKGLADADGTAGVQKILIDNDDDGDVDYVLLNTYYFGKVVTYVDSGDGSIAISVGEGERTDYYNKTMTRLTADDMDDVVGFEDVAKGDYVNAQYIGGDLHVSLAESVVGIVDSYKSTEPTEEVTVDGETYQVANVLGYVGGDDDIRMAADDVPEYVKEEVALYLDNNGYAVAFGEAEGAAGRYAMVLAKGTDVNDLVKVALADGTVATYTVNDSGNGLEKDRLDIGRVYAYSINSSDEIKLTNTDMTSSDQLTGAVKTFEKGKIAIKTVGSSDKYAYSNTAFFYVNDEDSTDYSDGDILNRTSIKNSDVETYASYTTAPDVNSAPGVYVYEKGDRVVAVVFAGVDMVQANVEDNLYVSKIVSTDGDETTVNAYVNGSTEVQTITVDGTDVEAQNTYIYTIKDGVYELSNEHVEIKNEDEADTVDRVTGNNFVLNGQVYTITSDTLIVDHSKYLDSIVATLGTDGTISKSDKIIGLVENDGEALLVVIRNEKLTTDDDEDENVPETEVQNGDATLVVSSRNCAAEDVTIGSNGYLSWSFSVPTGLDDGGTVSYRYVIDINGSRAGSGTIPAGDIVDGRVDGGASVRSYDEGDDVVVTISNIELDADVTGDWNVTGSVTVDENDQIDVTGDVVLKNGETLTVKGTLMVTGDIKVEGTGSATLNVDGHVEATNVDTGATGTIVVTASNTLEVTGSITTGTLTVGQGEDDGAVEANNIVATKVDVAVARSSLKVTGTIAAPAEGTLAMTITDATVECNGVDGDVALVGAPKAKLGVVTGTVDKSGMDDPDSEDVVYSVSETVAAVQRDQAKAVYGII